MTATHVLAAGTNYTAIGIILAIFVPICAALAAIVGWYYRLQRHRADAVAMAAGITLPLWYWAPVQHYPHGLAVHGVQLGYFPNGPSRSGAEGFYIDTLPKALVARPPA